MIKEWASRGLKIIGLAYKEKENLKETKDFSWPGLVGIEDPLREGVKEAIETARQAGIKIKIVTGDYQITAVRIANNLGLNFTDRQIMEGSELETISDENLKERINEIVLFTRTTPHQKLKIIKALQEKGEIVAMTGDGVNDAPALKKADIGVVVGSGSDVAKEAGDLILLDNNFKTIVVACEEGRLIFSNLKKVIGYALSNSFAEIILIFGAIISNLPTPLTVVQILWIHLICDGPPDILLSFEPKENGLMQESPRMLRRENILSQTMKFLILAVSLSAGLAALFLFYFYLKSQKDLVLARTMAFTTLSLVDIVYIFAFKNSKKIIFQTENFFANKLLFLGLAYGLILIFAAIYFPVFNRLLGTMPLRLFEWFLIFAAVLMVTFLIEMIKLMTTRKAK
ncbi:MAG: HAD-IC family P-type ATPase [Patescibacteria group bacterium]|nr:HAD-IC family P-type ATPase [Patescibacteria group bacterium]MCL5095583.1 HAD-IC family P-type ATPase [Patescibacteria group bacterium]